MRKFALYSIGILLVGMTIFYLGTRVSATTPTADAQSQPDVPDWALHPLERITELKGTLPTAQQELTASAVSLFANICEQIDHLEYLHRRNVQVAGEDFSARYNASVDWLWNEYQLDYYTFCLNIDDVVNADIRPEEYLPKVQASNGSTYVNQDSYGSAL